MKSGILTATTLVALGVAAPLAASGNDEVIGNFLFRVVTDPMTDASRGIAASAPKDSITLVVKCDENGPNSLYVSFISQNYLGGVSRNRVRDVKYRIDDAPPETISAYYDSRTALITDLKPTSAGGRWFARTLAAKKLTVQLTSYDYDVYTQVIDLDGYRLAVSKAATTCKDPHWI